MPKVTQLLDVPVDRLTPLLSDPLFALPSEDQRFGSTTRMAELLNGVWPTNGSRNIREILTVISTLSS